MSNTKPIIKSTGVWGTGLATILSVATLLENDQVQGAVCVVVPQYCGVSQAIIAAVVAVLGAVGVRGRIKADTTIKGVLK